MYTILYTILTPSNGIVWYCKTPMEKAKSLVFCKMAFRGIVLYQGFDFLSLRRTPKTKRTQSMTNPVKSRFYGIFYFSSRTSISNLGYIISNLDTYVIIIPATFVSL